MTNAEIIKKLDDLKSLQRLIEEAQNEADALRDEIKDFMGSTEEITAGNYKVTYKSVTTSRVDTSALKKALPEVAERFSKTSTTRRFVIA